MKSAASAPKTSLGWNPQSGTIATIKIADPTYVNAGSYSVEGAFVGETS